MPIDVTQFLDEHPDTPPSYYHFPWYDELRACTACPARVEAKQVVAGTGPTGAQIMLLGQNPGEDEDDDGIPFVGRGGQELDEWLKVLRLARDKLLVTNIVKCHTTGNRVPKAGEIQTCTTLWLRKEIEAFTELKVIVPLGKPATKVLLGKLKTPGVLDPYRIRVRFGDRLLLVVPLPHPAYLLRVQMQKHRMYTQMLPDVRRIIAREEPQAYAFSATR